jgi:hypothetical protein
LAGIPGCLAGLTPGWCCIYATQIFLFFVILV